MFVIWNTTQKAYVAWPGRERSYTKLLQNARVFKTFEEAHQDCCGDEIVRDVRHHGG